MGSAEDTSRIHGGPDCAGKPHGCKAAMIVPTRLGLPKGIADLKQVHGSRCILGVRWPGWGPQEGIGIIAFSNRLGQARQRLAQLRSGVAPCATRRLRCQSAAPGPKPGSHEIRVPRTEVILSQTEAHNPLGSRRIDETVSGLWLTARDLTGGQFRGCAPTAFDA